MVLPGHDMCKRGQSTRQTCETKEVFARSFAVSIERNGEKRRVPPPYLVQQKLVLQGTEAKRLEHFVRVVDETSVASFREERETCSTESVDELERPVSRFDSNIHFGHSTLDEDVGSSFVRNTSVIWISTSSERFTVKIQRYLVRISIRIYVMYVEVCICTYINSAISC